MIDEGVLTVVEERIGRFTLTAAPDAGWVSTRAAQVLVAQGVARCVEEGAEAVTAALVAAGVPEAALRVDGCDVLVDVSTCVVTALPEVALGRIASISGDVHARRPAIRTAGTVRPWTEVAAITGTDALRWAAVRAADPEACPLVISVAENVLASRCDGNPLALLRHGHARAALATRQRPGPACHRATGAETAVQVVLAVQAARDCARTGRTRPLAVSLEAVAAAVVREAADAPGSRTHLTALDAARKVMHGALTAAGLDGPVPY